MLKESILTKDEITGILQVACSIRESGDQLAPVLFLHTDKGERHVSHLPALPAQADRKPAYFSSIGAQLRSRNIGVQEAVFVDEAWAVTGLDGQTGLAPSRHPNRSEAIVAIGRNAPNTRMCFVIQPFRHDKHKKLVWEKVPVALYNEPVSDRVQSPGLLDYLFDALEKG